MCGLREEETNTGIEGSKSFVGRHNVPKARHWPANYPCLHRMSSVPDVSASYITIAHGTCPRHAPAGNWETVRFLLSNARYWMDEFKFDGYRFDGVTSMMYHHHGLSYSFTGGCRTCDNNALPYLLLREYRKVAQAVASSCLAVPDPALANKKGTYI